MKNLTKFILEAVKIGVEKHGYTMNDVPETITVKRQLRTDKADPTQHTILCITYFMLDGKDFAGNVQVTDELNGGMDLSTFEINTKL